MRNLNDIVIVTGVSASGKDYLLSRALEDIDEEDHVTPVAFGTEIHNRIKGEVTACDSRDGLREVSATVVREFAREILRRVIEKEGTKILNTHVVYRQGDLVVADPATDLEVAARDYVFVSADPAEIVHRRKTDESRGRLSETEEMVALHQEIALASVGAIARVIGSRFTILDNKEENTAENVAQMRAVIAGTA